ncbi:MAG TPA: hypothetical protein VD963_10535 [Phycisphaerales bacterium]|nr:hypothetical protein [Phycisphaerales bacterium]
MPQERYRLGRLGLLIWLLLPVVIVGLLALFAVDRSLGTPRPDRGAPAGEPSSRAPSPD